MYLNTTTVTASEYSETLVKFQLPSMPSGLYTVSIKFYDRGLVATKLKVQYELKINSISSGSAVGIYGGVLSLSGQGFTDSSIIKLKTSGEICKRIEGESSITSLKCILPAQADGTTDEIVVVDSEITYECSDPISCSVTWTDA